MSRFKSPHVAARRAERAANEAEQLRKEARKNRLMVIGVIMLMAGSFIAYFVFYVMPHWNKAQRHEHHQHGGRTNASAPAGLPLISQTNHADH